MSLTEPTFENWWKLHNILETEQRSIKNSGGTCDNLDKNLFCCSTVKIRVEYSHYFYNEVRNLRMDSKAGDEIRRNFEAWLFFVRSTLDCLAQMVNQICDLGLRDNKVKIFNILDVLQNHKNLQNLNSYLQSAIDNNDGAWFWHLSQLRNLVTHRSVVKITQYTYIGMPTPKRDDLRFTLEDPNDLSSFSEKPEFGLGQYAEDQFNRVYSIVEKVCEILFVELTKSKLQIIP